MQDCDIIANRGSWFQTVFHSKLKFKNPYNQKLQAKGKII